MIKKGGRSRRSDRDGQKVEPAVHSDNDGEDSISHHALGEIDKPQHGSQMAICLAWQNFAAFCDDFYGDFTPRTDATQRTQEPIARIERRCVDLVIHGTQETWAQLVEQHFQHRNEQKIAHDFFYYLARRNDRRRGGGTSPSELLPQLRSDLAQFVDLAEYALTSASDRDLVRLDAIADVIRRYHGPERTFLFLSVLPSIVPDDSKAVLLESHGFQTVLRWGASRFLKDFWYKLQQKFRITRIAIKNEAAQNLARELGETESNMRTQLAVAHARIAELEEMLATTRSQARQIALCEFAQALQNHPNPTLDQIFALHQRIQRDEETMEGALSPDILRVFILLESILEAFRDLHIVTFPTPLDQPFILHRDQLGEFSYVEGSPFGEHEDSKLVLCLRPGWRVEDVIITPARVKEVVQGA